MKKKLKNIDELIDDSNINRDEDIGFYKKKKKIYIDNS